MRLSDFDFPFDPSLVALYPIEPRDQARLLVLPRSGGIPAHHRVLDLPGLLHPGDLVVVNDTKVLPARFIGKKRSSGGQVDMLLVKELCEGEWEVFLKGRVRRGHVIDIAPKASAEILRRGTSRSVVRITAPCSVRELMQTVGYMPLPPYIKRVPQALDRHWYQTVFASRQGAIAAPTAGLHLTHRLLDALQRRDIHIATVTLHVGPGTFLPVRAERVQDHPMEAETVVVPQKTVDAVYQTKAAGHRVVAVGTTVVRTLEGAVNAEGKLFPKDGSTNIFICPGHRFCVVDGLLTNFHLPRTTLLLLVSALVGVERLREAYAEAVREHYRFYSYGDAMLIL